MEHFITIKHNLINTDTKTDTKPDTGIIELYINCTKKTFRLKDVLYVLYTYTLNVPKSMFEDDLYAEHSVLLRVLPRACSILTDTANQIVCVMEGPTKFSGRTAIDEDPEDNQEESTTREIYNHSTVVNWAKLNQLEIVETEKANGKFAICRVFEHNGQQILMCGSKNNHVVLLVSDVKEWLANNKHMPIVVSIVQDIIRHFDAITNDQIMKMFQQGWSLVGELCDGQHFTPGDNTVSWFGLFKNGVSMETMDALQLLRDCGLKTVLFQVAFTPGTDPALIDNVFLAARCKNNEGAVLYCRNIQTNHTILVKSKSVWYIVKRFMRQNLLRGYKEIEFITKRFVDAQSYHGLNTDASVEITQQMMRFGLWMMSKSYPVSVLGIQPVKSVRGQLNNGFCVYWDQFLVETSSQEIHLNPNDFGPFDVQAYLNRTTPYAKRTYTSPAIVVFVQGLQGSGKSSLGNLACELLAQQGIKATYIEQDVFWGDTLSCQGALYHAIAQADGPDVIFVTRCNVCPMQFRRYVDIALKLPVIVTFATPQTINALYLMISLSGIVKRSNTGDSLMVGRFEYPIAQVVEFTKKNFDEFVPQSSINVFTTHTNNQELLAQAMQATTIPQIVSFVQTNLEKLDQLRVDLKTIATQIVNIALDTMHGLNTDIVVNPTPNYVGLAVSNEDKQVLKEFVAQYGDHTFVNYNHHCTLMFLGGKTKLSTQTTIPPGKKADVTIDALIVRKSDNACAYRIKTIMISDQNYQLKQTPHITARLPKNEKPTVSNSFVGLTNDSVYIVPFVRTLSVTCFWL